MTGLHGSHLPDVSKVRPATTYPIVTGLSCQESKPQHYTCPKPLPLSS